MVHHGVLRAEITHTGVQPVALQTMPWELLTRGSIADHFLWAHGEEIRATQMGKVCKPEVDTDSGTFAAVLMLWVSASTHLGMYGRDKYD